MPDEIIVVPIFVTFEHELRMKLHVCFGHVFRTGSAKFRPCLDYIEVEVMVLEQIFNLSFIFTISDSFVALVNVQLEVISVIFVVKTHYVEILTCWAIYVQADEHVQFNFIDYSFVWINPSPHEIFHRTCPHITGQDMKF